MQGGAPGTRIDLCTPMLQKDFTASAHTGRISEAERPSASEGGKRYICRLLSIQWFFYGLGGIPRRALYSRYQDRQILLLRLWLPQYKL